jgi:hypothetical protein
VILDADDVKAASFRGKDLLDERRMRACKRRDRDPEPKRRARLLARGQDADAPSR